MMSVLSIANISAVSLLSVLIGILWLGKAPPHFSRWWPGTKYNMPPGPQGIPIIGNLLPWLRARQPGGPFIPWLVEQARYGEMTTLHMGTKTWVLLNSSRVVNEIIIKKASVTHERPHFPIAGDLVSRGKRFFLSKSRDWKEGRQLMHHLMTGPKSKFYGNIVEEESLKLLLNCLDKPQEWYSHTFRFPADVIYRIATGVSLQKSRTELEEFQRTGSTFLTSINTSFVEFFPRLTWTPLFLQRPLWRTYWETLGSFHYGVFRRWWEALDGVKSPEAEPSFIRDALLQQYSNSDERAMYLVALLVSAGSDNTRMTLNAWFMSCLSVPEAFNKARSELESVCGGEAKRLPCLDDLAQCPYTCAVVKEVLRWRPTVPLVPQRVLVEDLVFENYRFPAGTEFLVNSISVCSRGHERSSEFWPDRWLNAKEGRNGVAQDLWAYAFSGGRRVCVGYKLAQKELFIAVARLIYCFDVKPRGDYDDKVLNAFLVPGEPFPIHLQVRSRAHEYLIRAAATEADKADDLPIHSGCGVGGGSEKPIA